MANNDQIIVWMNGKKTTIKRSNSTLLSQNEITKDEHAATIDKQPYQNDDTLTLPREEAGTKPNQTSPKRTGHKWKPIIIAIISAICMGSIFGLIMLKIVGTLGDYGTSQQPTTMIPSDVKDEEDNPADSDNQDGSIYTLPELKAYVIQGGVFEKEASVDDWKASFQDAAFSPVVWEQDGNYYLFVGIAPTKEQAKTIVTDIKETYGFDVFVKEWQTDQAELTLSKEGQQWVDAVTALWEESIENIDNNTTFPVEDWQDLLKKSPSEADQLEAFNIKLTKEIDKLDKPSNEQSTSFLLHVWNAIETELVP